MMYSPLRFQKTRTKAFLFIAALIVVGIVAMTTRAWLAPFVKLGAAPAVISQPPLSVQPVSISPSQLEVERITIRESGFDPEEIRRPAGQVIVAVDNRSGLEEMRLRLEREGGQRLVDITVNRRKLDWRKRIDLQPGRYRLTEVSHPDWLCKIIITP